MINASSLPYLRSNDWSFHRRRLANTPDMARHRQQDRTFFHRFERSYSHRRPNGACYSHTHRNWPPSPTEIPDKFWVTCSYSFVFLIVKFWLNGTPIHHCADILAISEPLVGILMNRNDNYKNQELIEEDSAGRGLLVLLMYRITTYVRRRKEGKRPDLLQSRIKPTGDYISPRTFAPLIVMS